MLVMGILYPADIAAAVAAVDGAILSYPGFLVEPTEYTLIANLQDWIYSFKERWDNKQYRISDNLYAAATLGIMYLQMVPALLNFRQAACKTNEAHGFHIQQYLASHGLLDTYMAALTRDQALFLYRNIAYIERNSGKQAVFEWLMEHIMTARQLPLAALEMQHDLAGQPTDLYPTLAFRKNPLNTLINYDLIDVYDLNKVLAKEQIMARDNAIEQVDAEPRIEVLMKNSLANSLKTKVLESTVIDYTGSEHYTLADVLLYEWMYLSQTGRYTAFTNVNNPVTGESIVLSAKDAYEFALYAICHTNGINLTTLPQVLAIRVLNIPKPSVDTLMSIVDAEYVPRAFAQEVYNMSPVFAPVISVQAFHEYCVLVQKAALSQYYMTCAEEHYMSRGMKHNLVSRLYGDYVLQTGKYPVDYSGAAETYAEWFQTRNIKIEDFSLDQLRTIGHDLITAATGGSSTVALTLKEIQASMVRLMTQLSSYSVQYLASINTTPILDAPRATIRVGDYRGSAQSLSQANIGPPRVMRARGLQRHLHNYNLGGCAGKEILNASHSKSMAYELIAKAHFDGHGVQVVVTAPIKVDVSYVMAVMPANPRNVVPVPGIETYLLLNAAQQASIPDLWHTPIN
jgi:hypothetical protein